MTDKCFVATQAAILFSFCLFSAGILYFFNNCLQNTKLMNIPHFGIKINLKLLKTCQENGLKIDEFYTHQSCRYAFEEIKPRLVTAPIRAILDWNKEFEIICDASDYAMGAVLRQRTEEIFRAIYYANKTFNEA